MLTKLIAASYAWLLEASLWITVVTAAVAGYHLALPLMNSIGLIVLAPEIVARLIGALAFVLFSFLASAMTIGPVLVLIDIRRTLRHMDERSGQEADRQRPTSVERREPSI